MRVPNESIKYDLSAEAIDNISEHLDERLMQLGVERRNRIRGRLLMENALVQLLEHYGDGISLIVHMGMRLNSFYMRITYFGNPYNPLSDEEGDTRSWRSTLLSTTGVSPTYGYSSKKNTIQMVFNNVFLSPLASLFISICAGLLLGFGGMALLPDAVMNEIGRVVFSPLFNVLGNILNVLAAPVVCLMVLNTMLNARTIEFQGGNRHVVAIRYFAMSVLLSCASVIVAIIVFHIFVGLDTLNIGFFEALLARIEKAVPVNIVDPFINSNTPQLLVICFIVANAIIFLGERTSHITELIHEANLVATLITNWVGNLVPLFVTMLLALQIWNGSAEILIMLWQPLLFSLLVTLVAMVLTFVHISVSYKVGIGKLVRKTWKAFALTIKTGTLDTSFGEAEYSCVHELGMSEEYTNVVLPQGLVLYMPASFMGTLAFILYIALNDGVNITLSWLIAAIILDVMLFVATPAVPGANLLAFIAIFPSLGIARNTFLEAMIFDIVFGIFANAANQTLLQMEMIRQSHHIGLLDEEVLRR